MRRIAFFTSTRADYGLLRPVMAEVMSSNELTLQLIASGTHFSQAHGSTWREIISDGFRIDARVDMEIKIDNAEGIAQSAAQVLSGVARELAILKPDVLVLLGDRYELLAAAQAAVLARVPIAHIHGGESTEGAIDESIRHAVTKLSHWHFASAEPYASRIRQMGEATNRVWNIGAPAMDNIGALVPVCKDELEVFLGLRLISPTFLVTYHPVTLQEDGGLTSMNALLATLDSTEGTIIITGTNADPGGAAIRASLQAFAADRQHRVALVESLGSRRYLSLMILADAVVGNSSSGLLEAPAIGVPTVDIGPRQQGRLRAPSVIHCGESKLEIDKALMMALSADHRALSALRETPYGRPGVSRRIVEQLKLIDIGTTIKPFIDRSCVVDT